MKVTIGICTWNRADLLERALDSLEALVVPSDITWEVVVVDNNSTDSTNAVIEQFDSQLPLRPLFEARPGKSYALNAAVREARGDYILWTDDDVIVDPKWLANYVAAFRRWPDAAFFGGPIQPLFLEAPTRWLSIGFPHVADAYAIRDLGPEPTPLSEVKLPYGANMAIRAQEQRELEYDVSLGPRPGSGLRGEETSLVRRLLSNGAAGWWIPEARVKHVIPKDRQTVAYLQGYYRGYGEHLHTRDAHRTSKTFLGRPRWLWREVVAAEASYRFWRVLGRPSRWVAQLKRASIAWGRMAGDARGYPR